MVFCSVFGDIHFFNCSINGSMHYLLWLLLFTISHHDGHAQNHFLKLTKEFKPNAQRHNPSLRVKSGK